MICEFVYGKQGDEISDYKELATPKEYGKQIEKRFPRILALYYPWETTITPKPVIYCYTKGQSCVVILSCIKWFPGRAGNYFAQHLVFEENDKLIEAGPAWLIKRRGFYIESLVDWSKRVEIETENYDWKPRIPESNYCIGSERKWGTHIIRIMEGIAEAWNGRNEQEKFVLLFDPKEKEQNDGGRLDLLYDLYLRIQTDKDKYKRWNYQFCTFDGQRGERERLTWDIVFVASNDEKTQEFYTKKNYTTINLKGNEL